MMIKIFLISACVAASANEKKRGPAGSKKPQSTGTKSRASASVDNNRYITQSDWDWNGNNPLGSRIRRMQADSYSQFANIDMPVIPDMSNFDFKDIKFPKIEIPNIEMPNIEMPNIEMPNIEMPNIEMPNIEMPKMKMPDIKISPEDIASYKGPGYRMSIVTINGETVVTINKDGNIEKYTVPAGSSKEKTSAILAETVVNN